MSIALQFLYFALSIVSINGFSQSGNISNHDPSSIMKNVSVVDIATSKDIQVSQNRQGNFAIGGPVAASLAFVGLNLAFISLLVPFVMTAISTGERRNYNDDSEQNSVQNQWKNLRNLNRLDLQGMNHLARSSKDNRETMDHISRFGQKLLKDLKSSNGKLKRSS